MYVCVCDIVAVNDSVVVGDDDDDDGKDVASLARETTTAFFLHCPQIECRISFRRTSWPLYCFCFEKILSLRICHGCCYIRT